VFVTVRGEGANYAMKDGISLSQFIASTSSEENTPELLKRYEAEMLVRGSEGVIKSRDAAEDHVEKSDASVEAPQDNKDWLAARIAKQAGDQGFKRVRKE
jgi:2-polyprenyl-6-methoxyphenol hydroxylase-like FAD-dependent oxidoreductase